MGNTVSEADLIAAMPASLKVERQGGIGIVRLLRADKRNALDMDTIDGLRLYFTNLPAEVRAVILCGEGDHFSAGLDLSEVVSHGVVDGVLHSRQWHKTFDEIQFAKVPVIVVLHGAVIGGGLELACSGHLRVAERNAYYGLPEGQRGIFVGGGGSVRLPRLIGAARMMDLMLTGRIYDAEEGQAIGLSHYLVDAGEGLAKAIALAERITRNAELTNFAVIQALPQIVEMPPSSGLLAESLMAAIAQGEGEAKSRLKDFLEKRAAKVVRD